MASKKEEEDEDEEVKHTTTLSTPPTATQQRHLSRSSSYDASSSSKNDNVHLWATVDPPEGEPTWHPLIEFVVKAKAPRAVHEGSKHRWRRASNGNGNSPPGIPATTLRDLYSVPTSADVDAGVGTSAGGRGAGITVANWQGGACLLYPPDVESYCSMSSFEHEHTRQRQGRRAHNSQPCRLDLRSQAAANASAACPSALHAGRSTRVAPRRDRRYFFNTDVRSILMVLC